MTNDKKLARKAELIYALKLLLTVVLAFAASLFFRRSMGIIAMFPIAFAICIGAAFINNKSALYDKSL